MHYTKMLKYQAAKIPKLFHVLKNYYDFAKIREERPTRKGEILPERVYDCFLLNQRVCNVQFVLMSNAVFCYLLVYIQVALFS